MNLDFIKPLLESGLITDDLGQQINEAWESKLDEARDQAKAELREEFARKYEHDRSIIVEALDKQMTSFLEDEIRDFMEERKAASEDRVKHNILMQEHAAKFNKFMVEKLAEEIREIRKDSKERKSNQKMLESFVVENLVKEVKAFKIDRDAAISAKVKLIAEGRQEIAKLKRKFIKECAEKVNNLVGTQLETEISQLKEDIKIARENNFGRKLYEAFAGEFSATHLNEKAETRKVLKALAKTEAALAESNKKLSATEQLVESKNKEVRIIKESVRREKVLSNLLSPLAADKAKVMKNILESTRTEELELAFNRYLPSVLNNGINTRSEKTTLNETKVISEVTGDKTTIKQGNKQVIQEQDDNVIELKRLAGI